MYLRKSYAGLFFIQAIFLIQLHLQNYVQQKKQCNQTIKPPGELCCFGFFVTFMMMVPSERPKITPCACFPKSFESVVRSFSAGEISLPPPLSDVPGNMYQTCNTLFDETSRHWEGDWKMRQSQDFGRLTLRFLDIWWNTEWCVWYSFNTDKQFLKKWKVKVLKILRKLSCHCSSVQRKYIFVVSNSPGLADFAIRLVNSVFNFPDGQVVFFEEFE